MPFFKEEMKTIAGFVTLHCFSKSFMRKIDCLQPIRKNEKMALHFVCSHLAYYGRLPASLRLPLSHKRRRYIREIKFTVAENNVHMTINFEIMKYFY